LPEIWFLIILLKSVEKIQIIFKTDKNSVGHAAGGAVG